MALPPLVHRRKNVELARWGCTAGCPGYIAAQSRAKIARIETGMRADEELEARVAKADATRNAHHDETKKRKVTNNEEVDTGACVEFGTSSSSASGAAPLVSTMASASGAGTTPPRSEPARENNPAILKLPTVTLTLGKKKGQPAFVGGCLFLKKNRVLPAFLVPQGILFRLGESFILCGIPKGCFRRNV